MNYQTFKIEPSFHVKVVSSRGKNRLSDADERCVNELWKEAELEHKGHLFNGKMLNFVSFQPEESYLLGEFLDYKYYIAQLKSEYLKSILNIHPISISCLCFCEGSYLIGKRGPYVTDYPGYYEFVPSGGIDPINVHQGNVDLIEQLKMELMEETGILGEQIKKYRPFVFVQDSLTGIYEICLFVELMNQAEHFEIQSKEYDHLEWMSHKKIKDLILAEKEIFVPFSLFLFESYCNSSF